MTEIDDLEGRLARGNKRRRRILFLLGAAAVIGAVSPCAMVCWRIGGEVRTSRARHEEYSHRATAAEIATVDQATRALEARLGARAAAWRAGMAAAATMRPRPDFGLCPVRVPVRQPASAQRGFSFNNLDELSAIVFPGRQGFPHAVAHGGKLPDEPPRVRLARERAAELRESIRGTGSRADLAGRVRSAQALAGPGFWTFDVVLFADEWHIPLADTTGTSFRAGAARGTAVLFDYPTGTVLCAGDVTATTTSDRVEYRGQITTGYTTLQSMLDAEFDAEVERAIATAVEFRAGPPKPPPAPGE